MDRQLQELARAAVAGDLEAAYRYYILKSKYIDRERLSGPGQAYQEDVVDFEARNFNGPLKFTAISETYVIVGPAQEPNSLGSLSIVPVYINGVPYRIRRHLYYYPDAEPYNWVFHDPEAVEKAKRTFQKSNVPYWHSWQNALDPSDVVGNVARIPNDSPPTQSALRLIDDIIPRVVASWANQNRELLRKSGLGHVNNEILDAEKKLLKVEEQAQQLREQIGRLVIDELRLQ